MVDAASGALGMMAGGFADAAIVNSLSSAFSCPTDANSSWYAKPVCLTYGLIKVLYLVAIFLLVKYNAAAMQHAKSICWSLASTIFYRKTVLVYKSTANLDSFLVGTIRQTPSGDPVRMVPLFWEYENSTLTVWHARWIHDSHMQSLRETAQENLTKSPGGVIYASRLDASKGKVSWIGVTLNRHFMSRQCKTLCSSIRRNFAVQNCTGDFFPFCMLICGRPGLGKTYAVECLAAQHGVSSVRIANLSESKFHNTPLEDILKSMMSTVTESTVFAIDEIDQHLDAYIRNIYHQACEGGKTPPNYEQFNQYHRTNALFALRNLLDRAVNAPCAIVLMANSYNTIYAGVEMTHHNALDDRINRIEFVPCDRADIIDYMDYLRECMSSNPDIAVSNEEYSAAVSKLGDCNIPYREMVKRFQKSGFYFETAVGSINEYCGVSPVVPDVMVPVVPVEPSTVTPTVEVPEQPANDTQSLVVTATPVKSNRFDDTGDKVHYCTKSHGKRNWIHCQKFSDLYQVGMQPGDCEIGECSSNKHKCQMSDLIDYGLYLGKKHNVKVIDSEAEARVACENDAVDVLGDYHLCRRCANEVYIDGELCESQYLLGTASCHNDEATTLEIDKVEYSICLDCAAKYHQKKGLKVCASCPNAGIHKFCDQGEEILLCDYCYENEEYGVFCRYPIAGNGVDCRQIASERFDKTHSYYCTEHFHVVYGDPPIIVKERTNVEWTQEEAELVNQLMDSVKDIVYDGSDGEPVVKYAQAITKSMLERDPNLRHIVSLILTPDVLATGVDTIDIALEYRLGRYTHDYYK